jgi:putative hemolysin
MLLELLIIALLVTANGLFAGAEIAIVGVDRLRLRQLVEQGRRGAHTVEQLRANPENFLATVQIVITIVGASAGAFGGATLAADIQPLFEPMLGERAELTSFVLVVGGISYLSLVFGELVPKSLALRYAETYALLTAPILAGLSRAARPLVWLLTKSSNLVLGAVGDQTNFTEARLSPAELRALVDEATEKGSLHEHVGELASRALEFAQLTVAHVMIPRTRIVAIPRDASDDEIRSIVLEHAFSRLPVYSGSLDQIVGYVLYKDLVALAWERRLIVLQDLLRPPYFISRSMPCAALLFEMRQRRQQLAIVLDEHGGTAGIVTLDDLVEELTGEALSEIHDDARTWIEREPDGSLLVRGDVPLRDVNRELELELEAGGGHTTLGGLCMFLAGGVPETGALLRAPNGVRFKVERATERTVELIRILPNEPAAVQD